MWISRTSIHLNLQILFCKRLLTAVTCHATNVSVYMMRTSYKFMDSTLMVHHLSPAVDQDPHLTSHHVIYFSQEVSSHMVKHFLRADEFVIVITTRQRFSCRWKTSCWSKKVKQLIQHHLLLCVSGVTDYQPGWLLVVILSIFWPSASLLFYGTPSLSPNKIKKSATLTLYDE